MWKRMIVTVVAGLILGAFGNGLTGAEKKAREGEHQKRLNEMAEKLGLSAEQKDKVDTIFKEYQEKISALEKERHDAISKVLTDEQRTKLEEMRKERRGHKPDGEGKLPEKPETK